MQPGAIAATLGAGGALSRDLPGFLARPAQLDMAAAVARALADQATLIVEAGTGTGKTYAYLVPILLSGRRSVVSTGTKSLQDQLFHRDLPRLLRVLRLPARVALLKGRNNYLCLHRLQRAQQMPGWRFDERLEQIERWSRQTDAGDLAELGNLPAEDPLRPRITSTADNCLGAKCPDFAKCFVVKARRAAQGADLVVVNHHLLFADYALKEEGFGEILPGADAVIVDEAHLLPELAAQFFGTRVSTRQFRDIAQDALDEAGEWGDLPELEAAAQALARAAEGLERHFTMPGGRLRLAEFLLQQGVAESIEAIAPEMSALHGALARYRERSAALDALAERAEQLGQRWALVTAPEEAPEEAPEARVRWVEARGRGGSLHTTPVEVGSGFTRMRATLRGAWVFTSATLSAGGSFSHYRREMGLEAAQALALDSPFDYAEQARLYLPADLPEPNDPSFTLRAVDAMLPVIEASGGGVFVLCTSHRALRAIAQKLRGALGLPLFVQGEDDRSRLVEHFARAGDGVLVGTSSFWEGVDVKGRALRVVIIDRLPFAPPGDPVAEARLEAIRRAGGNPFRERQLPEAIVMLRQGIGRLIRDRDDRGLIMLCDPRLKTRRYGRDVLAALPVMPLVDAAQALQWVRAL